MKGYDVGLKKLVMPMGEHGGMGGEFWDDGVFSSIKTVELTCDLNGYIRSIRTEYVDDDGNSTWSDRHGANITDIVDNEVVVLDYPNEYLVSIHGCLSDDKQGNSVIQSLTLESNIKSYGPYGKEGTKKFWFPTTGCKIVGFHGKSGHFLDCIGFKAVSILNNAKTPSRTLSTLLSSTIRDEKELESSMFF